MQVEIITEQSKFLGLEPLWNPLLQESGTHDIFLTFEWLSTWWRHFGKENRLFIVLVKNQEQIVGIAPLMIMTREGFWQLGAIGDRTTDYKDFIIASDQDREAIIEAIFSTIVEDKSWDFFELKGFREDSCNFQPLKAVLSRFHQHFRQIRAVWYDYHISPYIPIHDSWERYWSSLRKGFRDDSLRRIRRLNLEKGTVSYYSVTDQKEVDLYMEEFCKHHIIRWSETKKDISILENLRIVNFYKDLARQMCMKKWLRLNALLVNGEIGAIFFGFEYANKYFYYIPTFNYIFSKYSVGRLLNLHLLRDAFIRELREYDFLVGNEPYKFDFNPKVRKLYSIAIFQESLRGYASEIWFYKIRPKLVVTGKKLIRFQKQLLQRRK